MLLDEIKGPNDIKKIEKEDYGILAGRNQGISD